MSKNILKDETKASLVKGEKNRYPNAAQYFIDGGNKFYENYVHQVKQAVNLHTMRGRAMEVLTARVEEMKKSIHEKIDNIKEQYKKGFGDFLTKSIIVLESSIIGLHFFGDKLKTIYNENELYISQFMKNLKNVSKKGISELKDFFNFNLKLGIDVVEILGDIIYKVSGQFYNIMSYIMGVMWDFFNADGSNVFVDLLKATGRVAGERASGAIGILMDLILDKVNTEVQKRPVLKHYFKFGTDAVNEINDIENTFRSLTNKIDDILLVDYTIYDEWGNASKRSIKIDDKEEIRKHFNKINESINETFQAEALKYNVNNIFSELNQFEMSPIERIKHYHIGNEITDGLDKNIYVSKIDYHAYFKLKEFRFSEVPKEIVDAEVKVVQFLDKYGNIDNKIVKEVKTEWEKYQNESAAYQYIMIRPMLYTILLFESSQNIKNLNLNNYEKYDRLYHRIENLKEENESFTIINDYFQGFASREIAFSKLKDVMDNNNPKNMFGDLKSYGFIRTYFKLDDSYIVLNERKDVAQKIFYMNKGVDANNIYFIGKDDVLNQYNRIPQEYRGIDVDENDTLAKTYIGEKQGANIIDMIDMMIDGYNKLKIKITKNRQRRAFLLSAIVTEMEKLPKK